MLGGLESGSDMEEVKGHLGVVGVNFFDLVVLLGRDCKLDLEIEKGLPCFRPWIL